MSAMNRGAIVLGLIVLAGMLFVPPREVRTHDSMAETADEMFGGDTVTRAEHSRAEVVYLPLTYEITAETIGQSGEVQSVKLATNRLLLQILVVLVGFGGAGLLIGRNEQDSGTEPAA